MDLSVIIPLLNEEESLPELSAWIDKVCKENGIDYEVIFVDDGSTDTSWHVITELRAKNARLKGIRFQRNYGKAAALNTGFKAAAGDIVITMDADLQDSPDEIPELVRMIREDGFDLVSGWKKKRYDPITKTIPTKVYNWAARRMSGIHLHDFNCGLKAYRLQVVKSVEVYGEMHRYIPIIAKWSGFKRIGEKVVIHQARKYGATKYGLSRFINGFLDLISITFMTRFGRRPMHFFGLWGSVLFFGGFLIAAYLAYAKVFHSAYRMTDRPLFYIGLLAMILGTQLFTAGFLGELIHRNGAERDSYIIAERQGVEEEHDNGQ